MSFDDVANRMKARHSEGMLPSAAPAPLRSTAVDADAFVRSMEQSERQSRRNTDLLWGTVLLVLGIGITSFTYDAASQSGGTYIVAYGPIAVGIIRIIRGLAT